MTDITRLQSHGAIQLELERLFSMQTNDKKVGEIKVFLRDGNTKNAKWNKDEYHRLLRLITSCDSQFRSKDGRIEYDNIQKLMNGIESIRRLKIESTQRDPGERVQRILGQRR